jgi:MFS superfamily sulfate permease-like transporter
MNAALRRTKTHWLFDYQKEWLRWDLMAGLITAAVVIPKAMAYATMLLISTAHISVEI